jgi:hypothetical protein
LLLEANALQTPRFTLPGRSEAKRRVKQPTASNLTTCGAERNRVVCDVLVEGSKRGKSVSA